MTHDTGDSAFIRKEMKARPAVHGFKEWKEKKSVKKLPFIPYKQSLQRYIAPSYIIGEPTSSLLNLNRISKNLWLVRSWMKNPCRSGRSSTHRYLSNQVLTNMPIKYENLRHQDSTSTPIPSNPLTPCQFTPGRFVSSEIGTLHRQGKGDLENGVRDTTRALDLKCSTSQKALKTNPVRTDPSEKALWAISPHQCRVIRVRAHMYRAANGTLCRNCASFVAT